VSALFSWLARLFGPKHPPLVAVKRRCTGDTIERAIYVFERDWSEEAVSNAVVQERTERPDGLLVRYEVLWKVSVFDDHPYGTPYVSWALLVPADPAAGDSADARFRVASATAEHHMREMSQ
jgi:hypothetical protein